MHRAKSNTSLDERALTEAAKALALIEPENDRYPEFCRIAADRVVTAYLAALPEPPLDEWLKSEQAWWLIANATLRAHNQQLHPADEVQKSLLEALAEHRKEGQHG